MQHQIFIENMFHVLVTVFVLVFSIHILVCCFIAIGYIESHDVNKSWLERLNLHVEGAKSSKEPRNTAIKIGTNGYIYWTAVYFITTTITTTGYGDIYGVTLSEKSYIIFLLFTGILVFTVIQHRTR